VLYQLSGLSETTAWSLADHDPQEMFALTTGRAERVWPRYHVDAKASTHDDMFRPIGFEPYGRTVPPPHGTLAATDVTLTELVLPATTHHATND
jgi:hypothetical protein